MVVMELMWITFLSHTLFFSFLGHSFTSSRLVVAGTFYTRQAMQLAVTSLFSCIFTNGLGLRRKENMARCTNGSARLIQ